VGDNLESGNASASLSEKDQISGSSQGLTFADYSNIEILDPIT
jgi:hypothetical protein